VLPIGIAYDAVPEPELRGYVRQLQGLDGDRAERAAGGRGGGRGKARVAFGEPSGKVRVAFGAPFLLTEALRQAQRSLAAEAQSEEEREEQGGGAQSEEVRAGQGVSVGRAAGKAVGAATGAGVATGAGAPTALELVGARLTAAMQVGLPLPFRRTH
jgi:hypothetical protein